MCDTISIPRDTNNVPIFKICSANMYFIQTTIIDYYSQVMCTIEVLVNSPCYHNVILTLRQYSNNHDNNNSNNNNNHDDDDDNDNDNNNRQRQRQRQQQQQPTTTTTTTTTTTVTII